MKENKEIEEATVEIVKMSQDEKIRKLAELREKAIMDEKATFSAGIKKVLNKVSSTALNKVKKTQKWKLQRQ